MLDRSVDAKQENYPAAGLDVAETVRELSSRELAPLVSKIDSEGLYPESVMRAFGRAGAFARHLPGETPGGPDLVAAIRAMAAAGEHCLSTAVCMWCQNALAWYIFASANEGLKADLGRRVASGEALGGTGISNPMKAFFGIEKIRLRGRRVDGGYLVHGALPYVSNLGADHYFGAVFEVEDAPKRYVMAIVPCGGAGVALSDNTKFVALDGTRTFSVELRAAAGGHGHRVDPRLHRAHESGQGSARPRQQIPRRSAGAALRQACGDRSLHISARRNAVRHRPGLLASRDRGTHRDRRDRGGCGACRDASLRRSRLRRQCRRPAPAA